MAAGMELVRPESLRHHIENVLRQAIMSGRLAPGARLVERELCESLDVSRTSVREALRSLEAEKLGRTVPHKGPMVAVMSRREASDLYAIRGLLAGFGDGAKRLRAAALASDQPGVLAAKTHLYDILLDNCGNVLVKEILTSMYSRINLLRATSLMHPDRLPSSLKEIDALFKALKARDADAAEAAARLHVANAEKAAIRMLEEKSRGSEARGLPSGNG